MSEQLPYPTPETAAQPERALMTDEQQPQTQEVIDDGAEQQGDTIAKARAKIAEQAVLQEQEDPFKKQESENSSTAPILGVQRELKAQAYAHTLRRIREALPGPQRAFSKVIHAPLIEQTTAIATYSVGRSTGLLGGGIAALIGSATFLFIARHYGYQYNYALPIMCFIVGYIVASVIEGVHALCHRHKPDIE